MYSYNNSCPDPWSPAWHSSPEHFESYWLIFLQVCTKNGQCPNLLTFQHVAWPGCSGNLEGECQYFGLLVFYGLHYFYSACYIFQLSNFYFWRISSFGSVGTQLEPSSPSLDIYMHHQRCPLFWRDVCQTYFILISPTYWFSKVSLSCIINIGFYGTHTLDSFINYLSDALDILEDP